MLKFNHLTFSSLLSIELICIHSLKLLEHLKRSLSLHKGLQNAQSINKNWITKELFIF